MAANKKSRMEALDKFIADTKASKSGSGECTDKDCKCACHRGDEGC